MKKIIILGGGSSGWMTAAALITKFPDINISLIESSDIPVIGVGESTLGAFHTYLDLLDTTEEEWMPFCNATYKLSIDFTNWDGKGNRFHYPFGTYQRFIDDVSPIDDKHFWFLKQGLDITHNPTEYSRLLFDTIELIEKNKFTKNENHFLHNFNCYGLEKDYAYHFDANLFGEWLKTYYCKPREVEHIIGTYVGCEQHENGNIKCLLLEGTEEKYYADLFVDCTGFRGLLIDKVLNVEFSTFNDILINDRALATTIPYTDKNIEMETNTNATTMNAGWCWNIPLYNRIGTGYVYSSQFLTDDEAEKEFREYLSEHRLPFANKEQQVDFNKIKFNTGIRKKPFHKNVVSIGLSSGFIEPLESTGLLLTHKSINHLVNLLEVSDNGKKPLGFLKSSFNNWVHNNMTIASFIALHYSWASRTDTPYWKHITNDLEWEPKETFIFDGLILMKKASEQQNWSRIFKLMGSLEGMSVIMAGMGYRIATEHTAYLTYGEEIHEKIRDINEWLQLRHERNIKYVNTLPTHYEYLKENIYNGEE